ncbi:PLP-dependent aminotransferase family protein [Siminovitchia fordii]|uniref:aminotransferase-like domain-containing protein n=1 Tax=Siminovitchia fordii TaxID=254759 RepID=UPI00036E5D37|nr:PLP-dependent aminotransferase family protein [Siminovitchia fordii]
MKKVPMYARIAQLIRQKIDRGEWVIGTKIPTQRELAEQFQVNRSTVITAIDILKSEGLLEGIAGSGIYVTNNKWSLLSSVSPPNWKELTQWAMQPSSDSTVQLINDLESRKDLIQLSKGELGPDLYPHVEIEKSLIKVSRQLKEFGYGNGLGDRGLREEISRHLLTHGVAIAPENILIVSGALQALKLISTGILNKGATVFLENPSYLHSIHFFRPEEMAIRPIAVDRNGLRLDELFQHNFFKHSSALYINPTFHNPTGTTMQAEQRMLLMEKSQTLQLPVIEDDIFRDLWIDEPPPPPLKSLDIHGQVLYIGSFSKTIAPGLRIGWLAGPETVVKRLSDVRMQTDYGSSYISQLLVREVLASGLYEKHLIKVRGRLKEKRDFLLYLLNKYFTDDAIWEKPAGGFFIRVVLKEKINLHRLYKECLNRSILINPGFIYNDPAPSIRLSYAYATEKEMEEGIIQLKKIIKLIHNV